MTVMVPIAYIETPVFTNTHHSRLSPKHTNAEISISHRQQIKTCPSVTDYMDTGKKHKTKKMKGPYF